MTSNFAMFEKWSDAAREASAATRAAHKKMAEHHEAKAAKHMDKAGKTDDENEKAMHTMAAQSHMNAAKAFRAHDEFSGHLHAAVAHSIAHGGEDRARALESFKRAPIGKGYGYNDSQWKSQNQKYKAQSESKYQTRQALQQSKWQDRQTQYQASRYAKIGWTQAARDAANEARRKLKEMKDKLKQFPSDFRQAYHEQQYGGNSTGKPGTVQVRMVDDRTPAQQWAARVGGW